MPYPAAVTTIGHHRGKGDAPGTGPIQHRHRQRRFRREGHYGWHAHPLTPGAIVGPARRQIQASTDRPMQRLAAAGMITDLLGTHDHLAGALLAQRPRRRMVHTDRCRAVLRQARIVYRQGPECR
jgi:hypothetical protein